MFQPINITESQRIAADPEKSVWVTANAGTGKTKVLTDRVLRLLLTGITPEKILCLTYTKAAAAEMQTRLQKELSIWARLNDEELTATINMLTGNKPNDLIKQRARSLFLKVIDAPEGVRILTIHSLCQSLLKRFAIEAGISPYFRLMEDSQSSFLLSEARRLLFTEHRLPKDIDALNSALNLIASRLNEDSLDKILNEIISKRNVFEQWFRTEYGADIIKQKILDSFNIGDINIDPKQEYFSQTTEKLANLGAAAGILHTGTEKTDQPRAKIYDNWLRHFQNKPNEAPDDELFESWISCFLTQKYEKIKSPITKSLATDNPEILDIILLEQDKIYALTQKLFAQEATQWSFAVLSIAEALLALHTKLKRDKGFLDYNDLISNAHQLLEKEGIAPWILFKLDSGIDHLLVDEAQDTSPIQWQIIRLLADEFFTGQSARKIKRSLFVVGDEKQSIYRFQGADPEEFARMKQHFAQRIQQAEESWQPVSLSLSFRSTPAVLEIVDSVFNSKIAANGVIEHGLISSHKPNRSNKPGRVELWSLNKTDKTNNDRTPWQIPDSKNASATVSADAKCAKEIADKISKWLKEKRFIPARNRAIDPSDILILVRNRNPFFYRLIRALKKAGIPVAGEDRLKLLDQIAVQDILALIDFLLLPQDDLSLACVLKSPIFGISEDELFELAYERDGSLWQQVQNHKPEIASTLKQWLNKLGYLRPYELLAHILEASGVRTKLAAQLGTQIHDPVNELLNLARDFERLNPPSLQGFIQELRREEITIKRDAEQASGNVRVMTVHGSKGLQAPIVIIPDTTSKPSSKDSLLWFDEFMLYAPDDSAKNNIIQNQKEYRKQTEMREYNRLLYVAMTRAADELYVTGWLSAKAKDPAKDCWYSLIADTMYEIGTEQTDGSWAFTDNIDKLSNGNNNCTEDSINNNPNTNNEITNKLPNWFNQPPPEEPSPTRPLTPSKPNIEEPASDSPLIHKTKHSAQRGILIHRLLEILPDIEIKHRKRSAKILLDKYKICEKEQQKWISEVIHILNNNEFTAVFGENSIAEVPVTALLKNGQVISGQVDRLVVLDDSVIIIDYKTSSNIPASAANIPEYFKAQMQAYIDAIAPIYPSKRIEAAILWTNKPLLMPLALTPSST